MDHEHQLSDTNTNKMAQEVAESIEDSLNLMVSTTERRGNM
jgi:hypothetical protein